MQLDAVLDGEHNVGQHIVLAAVHELGELWPACADLVGDVARGCPRLLAVGLAEDLKDGRCDDRVLATRNVREGVPHSVHAAALPRRVEHPGVGGLEAGVGVGDH